MPVLLRARTTVRRTANYEATLKEVVDAPDALPEQRLQNTIAKRRARRYLGKSRMANCGF
jgi:hypothetical protein